MSEQPNSPPEAIGAAMAALYLSRALLIELVHRRVMGREDARALLETLVLELAEQQERNPRAQEGLMEAAGWLEQTLDHVLIACAGLPPTPAPSD